MAGTWGKSRTMAFTPVHRVSYIPVGMSHKYARLFLPHIYLHAETRPTTAYAVGPVSVLTSHVHAQRDPKQLSRGVFHPTNSLFPSFFLVFYTERVNGLTHQVKGAGNNNRRHSTDRRLFPSQRNPNAQQQHIVQNSDFEPKPNLT